MILAFCLGLLIGSAAFQRLFKALWQPLRRMLRVQYNMGKKVDILQDGSWVVVTGATDGIGLALTKQLAQRGHSLYLISRSDQKLMELQEQLEKQIPQESQQKIRVFAFDFSTERWSNSRLATLKNELDKIEVNLLINNVGIGYPHPMSFEKVAPDLLDDLINVNLRSTIRMTHLVLAKMIEKRRGIVLNIGSAASEFPCLPLYTVYAAVKAGVASFSDSLQAELYDKNIVVRCFTPGYVCTKLSKKKSPNWFVLTPDQFAIEALATIESEEPTSASSAVQCPSFAHNLLIFGTLIIPRYVYTRLSQLSTKKIMAAAEKKACAIVEANVKSQGSKKMNKPLEERAGSTELQRDSAPSSAVRRHATTNENDTELPAKKLFAKVLSAFEDSD